MRARPSTFSPVSYLFAAATVAGIWIATVAASPGAATLCEGHERSGPRENHCEVREYTVSATSSLDIDGGKNGGVEVVGSSRSDVRISAAVWAYARSEERARDIAAAVRVEVDGGRLRAEGPSGRLRNHESWGVNWLVEVPEQTNLAIETHNGGISLEDVEGRIRFNALNGAVELANLAGEVRGHTINGGLRIALEGRSWDGREMDVETTNGSVVIDVPDGYSAELETGTVNGRMEFDIPVTVRGRIDRRIRTQLGDGGASIRAVTTNGRVEVRSRQ